VATVPIARRRGRLSGRPTYLLLALVAVVALVVGSRHTGPETNAQRVTYLESVIKCPDCADLTIGQSSTGPALGLRDEVVRLVGEGKSNAFIEHAVVYGDGVDSGYGPQEILAPHGDSGFIVLAVPIGAFLVAAAVLLLVLVRRRRAAGSGGGGSGVDEEDLALVAAALDDRRGSR
jgi:cytochrome c-type biogenesis protein CcmH